MVIGVVGHNGEIASQTVGLENRQEEENATILCQNMVESHVKDKLR